MTWKLGLDVGRYDVVTRRVAHPLEAAFVQQVIVQAGGFVEEGPKGPQHKTARRLARARAASGHGSRVLGYLGEEEVRFYAAGSLYIAIGGGPNPAALAFLRMLAAEGCTIWTEDGEATQSILAQFAAIEARWAARNKV